MFSGIKIDFSQVLLDSRGKYRIAMIHSILERKYLWHHTSKSRKANNVKICMFTSIMRTIISTKFKINSLPVTLFFWIRTQSPPPPPLAKPQNAVGRFTWCDLLDMSHSCYSAETKERIYKSANFEEVLSNQSIMSFFSSPYSINVSSLRDFFYCDLLVFTAR